MWRLAALAGVTEPLVFIIALPDLFTIGFIALITTPDFLAETTPAVGTNKPLSEYARESAKAFATLDFELNGVELVRLYNSRMAVFYIVLLNLPGVLNHLFCQKVCTVGFL